MLTAYASDVFKRGQDGALELGWSAAGVEHGEDLLGTCDSSIVLPETNDVVTLQDLYNSGDPDFSACGSGGIVDQLTVKLATLNTDDKKQAKVDEVGSLVDAAVAALEQGAVQTANAQLTSVEAKIWILMYRLSIDVRALGPLSQDPDLGDSITPLGNGPRRLSNLTYSSSLLSGSSGSRRLSGAIGARATAWFRGGWGG